MIHQPRFEVFTQFDDVLLLGLGGRTVYIGPTTKAVPYFESIGFVSPQPMWFGNFVMHRDFSHWICVIVCQHAATNARLICFLCRYHFPDQVNPADYMLDAIAGEFSVLRLFYVWFLWSVTFRQYRICTPRPTHWGDYSCYRRYHHWRVPRGSADTGSLYFLDGWHLLSLCLQQLGLVCFTNASFCDICSTFTINPNATLS